LEILVVGYLPYDSGKTTFIRGLIRVLKDRGFNPSYFKPVAGHSGWYQVDTVINSMSLGVLVGHDAYVIAKELDQLDIIDVLSPLDFITFPIDPLGGEVTPRRYMELMTTPSMTVALLRLTRAWIEDGKIRRVHTYVLNNEIYNLLNKRIREVVDELVGVIKSRSKNSVFIEGNSELITKILTDDKVLSMIDSVKSLLRSGDPLIIEGYNDVAAPTNGSLDSEWVFVVAPSKVLAYRGERYKRAVELVSYGGRAWTVPVSRIIGLLGSPYMFIDVPILLDESNYYKVFEPVTDLILGDR